MCLDHAWPGARPPQQPGTALDDGLHLAQLAGPRKQPQSLETTGNLRHPRLNLQCPVKHFQKSITL